MLCSNKIRKQKRLDLIRIIKIKNKTDEIYNQLKKECGKIRTICPENHILLTEVANTPMHLRLYFKIIGRTQATEEIIEKIDYLISKAYGDGKNLDYLWVKWNILLEELKEQLKKGER